MVYYSMGLVLLDVYRGWRVGVSSACEPAPAPIPLLSLSCGALGSWAPLEGTSLQAQERKELRV